MTTLPERLTSPFFLRVMDAILAQKTQCDFKIVLFVPEKSLRTGQPYPDPSFLHELYDRKRLMVHRCDDRGPATKFTGLLTYLPLVDADVTHIYIADDDIILRDHVFQRVLAQLEVRSAVQDCRNLVLANDSGLCHGMPTVAGYAGLLAPLGLFREMADDARLAPVWEGLARKEHPCFNVDDMLLSKLIHRYGYAVEGTGQNPFTEVMDRALTDEHPAWFELEKHTQRERDNLQCFHLELPR